MKNLQCLLLLAACLATSCGGTSDSSSPKELNVQVLEKSPNGFLVKAKVTCDERQRYVVQMSRTDYVNGNAVETIKERTKVVDPQLTTLRMLDWAERYRCSTLLFAAELADDSTC